ncbi:MAG: branched-chain amino acid ABC transporter permease [Candidatus Korarchaeota archaeon]|nr:branched-chain amino acid ABC transporter permease [Candidatus Korarchaeota archaeon]
MVEFSAYTQLLVSYAILGGVYGLTALGLSLIWGVMKAVNWAHGDFLMVGMYTAFWTVTLFGIDPYIAAIVAFILLGLLGMVTHVIAIEPVVEKPGGHEATLLTTLGISVILESLALILWSPSPRSFQNVYKSTYIEVFGIRTSVAEAIAFTVSIVAIVAVDQFLKRVRLGKAIRAVSQNPVGARVVGIDVPRIRLMTFGLGVALAGMAGVLVATFYPNIRPLAGYVWDIASYVVVIFAGLGTIYGVIFAGIIIGVTEGLGTIVFSNAFRQILVYVVFLTVLLLRPQGLFGKALRRV